MTAITALTEDFMGAAPATVIGTGNTIFDNVFGTGVSTFVADPYETGKQMMKVVTAANNQTQEADFTGVPVLYFRMDLDIANTLDVVTPILNGFDVAAGTNKVFDVRQSAGARTLQLRDVSTLVWTSAPLPAGQKSRVWVNVDLINKTLMCKVATGADPTVITDQSPLVASSSLAATIGHLRMGVLTSATGTLRFGALRGFNAAPVGESWSQSLSVRIGG